MAGVDEREFRAVGVDQDGVDVLQGLRKLFSVK